MTRPTQMSSQMRLLFAGVAGALAVGAIAALPAPAQARVWVSVGVPCCGYYGPGPYYGYYPPPYYYTPPSAYYYPPPAPPYPAPSPSAYAPPAAAPANPGPASSITYTSKPAFTNASGQTCREYMTNNGSGQPVYGTACQQADGVWRVVN
jgi:hypothetical protein